MATKKKIRDLNPAIKCGSGVFSRYDEYFNLLLNSVKITRKDGSAINYAVETFVKKALFENGKAGYDKSIDEWFYIYGEGKNKLGNPFWYNFVSANGLEFRRKANYEPKEDGAYEIDAMPYPYSLGDMIKYTTSFMDNCEVAMRQNLEACKTPYIVICKDEDTRLSLEQAIEQKQDGQAVVIVSDQLGEGLKAVDIGVNFLVDKFADVRNQERDTMLNKLGIMTSNVYKKERIQSAEVNATIGQATDYIYLIIDTFNKQCDYYEIDYMMSLNGSIEELYTGDGSNDEIIDVNDIEDKQEGGTENAN